MIGTEKIPRRRSETRKRLLEAAGKILLEHGIQRASIEEICERAGYTRGAFYSNFSSVDDLFFALYDYNVGIYLERLEEALTQPATPTDVREIVSSVLSLLPLGNTWQLLNAEFAAQAMRNPAAAQALAEHRGRLRERLEPMWLAAIKRTGRRPTVPLTTLVRIVMAVYDGAMTHSRFPESPALEPSDLIPLALQCVFEALTQEEI
ncbi:transcriptional regulator, TetR family [Renibacterium salmoninarum ATCC 33209]|uniref:Transcriptional regulator, TetR family n=1 Tax=Renibacterium salmoninarum (strain ATCC 33209 / DSM 20767 / JCM 11484 / NBRC 15589 / NCIMB 2235) TaxID=288705 RepID=A9WRI2_RENSM|nr:TetR/AcrR family transcriptional regulator [Renibacterium salmoninarum]ABY24264.1 transcriptional regulator, TetR family [Renibacterium salmoninarum ATCC 33209]